MFSETFSKFLDEFPELKAKSTDPQFWVDEPLWEACENVIEEGTDKERICRLWVLLRQAYNEDLAILKGFGDLNMSYTHYHYEQLQKWALPYQTDKYTHRSSEETARSSNDTARSSEDTARSSKDMPPSSPYAPSSDGGSYQSDDSTTRLWIQAQKHQKKEANYRAQLKAELEQREHWYDREKQWADYEQQRAAALEMQWFQEQKRRTEEQQAHEIRDLERRNRRMAEAQQDYEMFLESRRRIGAGLGNGRR